MRWASSAITACRSGLSMRCQRAISGSVRPQPKQRVVLGSIIQTAMHGVSWLILGSVGTSWLVCNRSRGSGAHDRLVARSVLLVGHVGGVWLLRLQRRLFFGPRRERRHHALRREGDDHLGADAQFGFQ